MSAIKLHVIKPSVNNMTARVFVRAAKLDFTEDDVYGKTRSPEFMGKNPAHLTPMLEAAGLPKGATAAGREQVGTITDAQLTDIATVKLPDLNTSDLAAAKRQVAGTARSMGIAVAG